MQHSNTSSFRERLAKREHLLGTFVKLPTTQAIEILGAVGFDFVIIDQEHAALDRGMTDLMILAARATNVAPIVRLGDAGDAAVLSALDSGATGLMFPHVRSAERARDIVAASRYAGGRRGFAGLTRASRWGTVPGVAHMRAQDSQVACIAMIEDVDAIAHTEAIAGVDGIDAVFIGRGDLTASFGERADAQAEVAKICQTVAAGLRKAGTPLMMLATSTADAASVRELGASALLVSSDHNFLLSAAAAALRDYADPAA